MSDISQIDIHTPIEQMNALNKGSLMESLGIEYTAVDEGYVRAQMPVDKRTVQPAGILSGGASLAFAEVLGGLGSSLLIDNQRYHVVGTQLSANHVGMAFVGYVQGEARLLHRGKKTHVWNIDITNQDGKLVSTARLTNMIIEKQQ